MNNILVTGAAGFIGSNLCEKLVDSNYYVTGIDNFDNYYPKKFKEENLSQLFKSKNFIFHNVDIRDYSEVYSLVKNKTFDLIIHLAARSGVTDLLNHDVYISNNIVGTQNMLNFAASVGCKKFIFASSSSVYGENNNKFNKETDNTETPLSLYAMTKKTGELLTYIFQKTHKIDIINLRFFTVYGPRLKPNLAIYRFCENIIKREPIILYNNGNCFRDFTYIDDNINGILGAINYILSHNNLFEIVNIGSNRAIHILDLVNLLFELFGKTSEIVYLPHRSFDVKYTNADIDKAKQLFGYSPSVQFSDGLKEFFYWFIKNRVG